VPDVTATPTTAERESRTVKVTVPALTTLAGRGDRRRQEHALAGFVERHGRVRRRRHRVGLLDDQVGHAGAGQVVHRAAVDGRDGQRLRQRAARQHVVSRAVPSATAPEVAGVPTTADRASLTVNVTVPPSTSAPLRTVATSVMVCGASW
jgi:hypothetical protein